MSGTDSIKGQQPDEAVTGQARHGLEQVEGGDKSGADQVDDVGATSPQAAEAAEQAASDGPEGRGLAR